MRNARMSLLIPYPVSRIPYPGRAYRNRSGGGVLSSSGAGVAEGSASGLGDDGAFFFGFFFVEPEVRTYMRRWRVLPVCKGIRTSS